MKKKTISKLLLEKQTISNLKAAELQGGITGMACITYPKRTCYLPCVPPTP
jgi:hypothetical protein